MWLASASCCATHGPAAALAAMRQAAHAHDRSVAQCAPRGCQPGWRQVALQLDAASSTCSHRGRRGTATRCARAAPRRCSGRSARRCWGGGRSARPAHARAQMEIDARIYMLYTYCNIHKWSRPKISEVTQRLPRLTQGILGMPHDQPSSTLLLHVLYNLCLKP